MARTSVNFVVGAGSAATLAASLAGIARADGYAVPLPWIGEARPPAVAGVVSAEPPVVEPLPSLAAAPAQDAATANVVVPLTPAAADLPPLPALQLSPGRTVQVAPMPEVHVASDGPLDLTGDRGSVDVSSFVPAPAPSQPSVVVAAPPQTAPASAPAPTVVAAPPPPPAPPPPTSTTKAS